MAVKTKPQLEAENKELQAQNDAVMEQMKLMQEQMKQMQEFMAKQQEAKPELKQEVRKVAKGIDPATLVKVQNMAFCDIPPEYSNQEAFLKFMHFGDIEEIRYDMLNKLFMKYNKYFQNLEIIILDEDVVKAKGLESIYREKRLVPDDFYSIAQKSENDMVNEFPKMTKQQLMYFVRFFIEKASDNEPAFLDMNKQVAIEKYFNSSFNISRAIRNNIAKKEVLGE